jgi:hypothetical protein
MGTSYGDVRAERCPHKEQIAGNTRSADYKRAHCHLLSAICHDDEPEYAEASRLRSFLEYFAPISPQLVPGQSILREFIGGSEFKY